MWGNTFGVSVLSFHADTALDLSGLTENFVFFLTLSFLTLVFFFMTLFALVGERERAGRGVRIPGWVFLKGAIVGAFIGLIGVIFAIVLQNTYDLPDVALSGAGFISFLAAVFGGVALLLAISQKIEEANMFLGGSGILLLVIVARPFLPNPPNLSPLLSTVLSLGYAAIGQLFVYVGLKFLHRPRSGSSGEAA